MRDVIVFLRRPAFAFDTGHSNRRVIFGRRLISENVIFVYIAILNIEIILKLQFDSSSQKACV